MFFLIITFGFLLAMRGAKPAPFHNDSTLARLACFARRPAPLQTPVEGLRRIGREAADFFLTASLILALWAVAVVFEKIQAGVREYALLGPGIAAYLLSRYQKKTDVFFLSVMMSVFMIGSRQHGLLQGILLAGGVSAGIAIFQACFLGLRYKLLFSRVPVSAKGWPVLCLLAGFASLVLWGVASLVF